MPDKTPQSSPVARRILRERVEHRQRVTETIHRTAEKLDADPEELARVAAMPAPTRRAADGRLGSGTRLATTTPKPQANTGKRPTVASDGNATAQRIAKQVQDVTDLARDGFSVRAIAKMLDMAPTTVAERLHRAAEEAAAAKRLSADALRDQIDERLNEQRTRILGIARDTARTVQERIAAERTLSAIEQQRADLLGLRVGKSGLGALGEWLDDLARRSVATDRDEYDATDSPAARRYATFAAEPLPVLDVEAEPVE